MMIAPLTPAASMGDGVLISLAIGNILLLVSPIGVGLVVVLVLLVLLIWLGF